jgi:type IV pilus assembly protein PilM
VGNSAVGIDIGTSTIAVAEVKQGRGPAAVTNFGGIVLPPDAAREGEILDVAAAAEALRELLGSAKVSAKKVWLGIANQRVVVRQLDLPWVEPKELRAALRYQVQEHIPIPVEEAELDVHVVGEFTNDAGERFQSLMLVAGHRDMVTSHVAVAIEAGLKPVGVDLNPFAVLRSMGETSPLAQGSQVLVDIGGGVTNILVHEQGIPTFVRILVMGGDNLTMALMSGLGLEREEAETRKRQLSVTEGDDVASRIAAEHAEQFVDEIRSSLEYYQAQNGSSRHSGVVLTGGGATLHGLDRRLEAALRLPVEIGSPFDRWEVQDTVYGPADLQRIGPSLATAVGLGLGGLG